MRNLASPNIIRPGTAIRIAAKKLLRLHPNHRTPLRQPPTTPQQQQPPRIRIVCVSDTHNHQPVLPCGDILIHAGDLTGNGQFGELQKQLDWLSSQPHTYKVVIAGNHDVLLAEPYIKDMRARFPQIAKHHRLRDLRWPSDVTYLQDSSLTLTFNKTALAGPEESYSTEENNICRRIKIFGSPWTPLHASGSVFQYGAGLDFWTNKIPSDADIVVTHGSGRVWRDNRFLSRCGCSYLAREIGRVRPLLHVFGHLHVGYGQKQLILDSARRQYEDIINFHSNSNVDICGWLRLCKMALVLPFWQLKSALASEERVTTFVNASVVGSNKEKNVLKNKPIVIEI